MPENSGLTPIMVAVGAIGSVSLRSTARPPDSASRTVICASSGREVVRQLVERDGELRLAVVVGLRQVFERGLLGLDLLLVVIGAELIAGKARALVRAGLIFISPSRSRLDAGAP